jgi:hypothetical protein
MLLQFIFLSSSSFHLIANQAFFLFKIRFFFVQYVDYVITD